MDDKKSLSERDIITKYIFLAIEASGWDKHALEYAETGIENIEDMKVLTESKEPAVYWRKLKQRLKEEGNQTVAWRKSHFVIKCNPDYNVESLLAKVTELENQIQERKILAEKFVFGVIKERLER